MANVDDLDRAIEEWRLATAEFIRGNPRPAQESFSHRADVTLANPLGSAAPEIGPVAHGWEQVALTQEHAASRFTDGADVDSKGSSEVGEVHRPNFGESPFHALIR